MNYCTLWPEWIGDVYIGGCCKAHDLAYDIGLDRIASDIALGQCVEGLGLPITGIAMTIATAVFGVFFYKKRKRT